ncbi:MAG: hypothetical protein NTX25_02390, partial [Proteobacteria bacterium]|nr:hypothetical protein [Pseudomonadota bacterium]
MNLRMNHGAKIALVAACLLGCGPKLQKSASQLSSIIDQNTMVVIDANTKLDDQIKRNLGAIGKMTGGCTAFHLGHGIVASAGHCIELAKQAWQQSTCYSIDIIWGQTLENQSPDHSRCMRILDYRYDEQVDYALFQVDPVPSASIEIEPVPRDLRTSAQAIVVGYPKNQTLNWSGICEANWSGRSDSQFFHHRCDT